jgi:hypothetical protein
MGRPLHKLSAVALAVSLVLPSMARGQEAEPDDVPVDRLPVEKEKPPPERERPPVEKPRTEKPKKAPRAESSLSSSDAPEAESTSVLPTLPEFPNIDLTRHRYAFVGGGLLLLGGLAFGYSAQGEAKRAETISSAREMNRTLEAAHASSATANILYALAATTIGYAIVMEVLPEPAAEKASLTFHF